MPETYELIRGDGLLQASSSRNIENGRTLFNVGGCASCHMSPNQAERTLLGGGMALKTAFGVFYPPNISSDPKDGIGNWQENDFIRAMRDGLSPDGRHYYPAFPYTSYRHMNPDDIADLFAYLKTLPAASGKIRSHDLAFPFNVRRALGIWKLAFLNGTVISNDGPHAPEQKSPNEDDSGTPNETARGRYLVEGPGHCAECHSPRNILGAIIDSQRFAGGPDAEGKGWVPNITPKGRAVESWSENEIAELLKTGFTPDYDAVGGAMGHVVQNTAKLSDEDRDAMADYLKSLPPRIGPEKPEKAGIP
jgi:mono/diheme cytochrome c family protein